jgi:hypothetical protein
MIGGQFGKVGDDLVGRHASRQVLKHVVDSDARAACRCAQPECSRSSEGRSWVKSTTGCPAPLGQISHGQDLEAEGFSDGHLVVVESCKCNLSEEDLRLP